MDKSNDSRSPDLHIINTSWRFWDRKDSMYRLTLAAKYKSKNTGKVSNLIQTYSTLSESKTLIKSELECIKRGIEDCGVRYGWEFQWELSETILEQWEKFTESPDHKR